MKSVAVVKERKADPGEQNHQDVAWNLREKPEKNG
jgi:hypothetical protein